jgi:hypothetical protein
MSIDLDMFLFNIIAIIIVNLFVNIHALVHCPGSSLIESQEEFKGKYDTASIVAYGKVLNVSDNIAKFQVNCLLNGSLSIWDLDLIQSGQ